MKKTIILSLLLAVILPTVHADDVLAGFNGPTWDTYRESITQGSGSEGNPYLITTPGQLAQLAYEVNNGSSKEGVCYKVAADISLNKRVEGERVQWVPIGFDKDHAFKGTLTNPDGHTITDMMISVSSSATIQNYGLIGCLVDGTVDGIELQGADLRLNSVGGSYSAGLLCGYMGGYVRHCQVEGHIEAAGISGTPKIGGLVGQSWAFYYQGETTGELSSSIAKTHITLQGNNTTGAVEAGGVAGHIYGPVVDCHALVEMDAKNLAVTSETSSQPWTCLGGLVGRSTGVKGSIVQVKYCSASGDVIADKESYTRIGGLIGSNENTDALHMSYCCTTVSVKGGRTLGGVIGCCYAYNTVGASVGTWLKCCASSSYVDGRDARQAGGFFGFFYDKSAISQGASVTDGSWAHCNYFLGTMTRPTSSNYYGVVFGRSSNLKSPAQLGYLHYHHWMCDLQTNGMGYDLAQTDALGGTLPNGDGYGCFGVVWGEGGATLSTPERAAQVLDNIDMCYTDCYKLCDLLFYITNDRKTLYRATDVSVDFSIDDIRNSTTGERECVFTVPDTVKCVRVEDKHLYPLDPGEVVVTVKWNGLERKVHLDITYGKEWDGSSSLRFDNVFYSEDNTPDPNLADYSADGSAEKPYLIHSPSQFNGLLRSSKYNKADVHVKLANDLFFNTHLLQQDGTPREDARLWEPFDFKAQLDGNGKTIYGLRVKTAALAEGATCGIFNNLYGSVRNLGIVDSDVTVEGASYYGTSTGLLCGTLREGAEVSNCLFHGRVCADNFCGGIAGKCDTGNTSLTDCFANVHITWPADGTHPSGAGGVCYDAPATLQRCLSTGRVEEFIWVYGVSGNNDADNACYFDRQMLAGAKNSSYIVQEAARTTEELVDGNLMADFDTWQHDENRYPMLKSFADTPYGKLLSMPVRFDGTDKAGDVNYIFEFPIEDVTWSALHGNAYLDVINDCGAASITERTDDEVEVLVAQAENVQSQCSRAMRTLPLNIRTGLTSFRFKDPVAQSAAFAAFNKEQPLDVLTLRELVEATKEDFAVFNDAAAGLKYFPELRYFTTVTALEEGMISGLGQLSELQLPKKLQTIEENAFAGCASLQEITLPATFTTLAKGGLYASGIRNLSVSQKHATMQSIDGALYQTDNDGRLHLVVYPPGRGEADAVISAPLDFIDDFAFYKVPNLSSVYIDNCLPEGNLVIPTGNDPIVHADADDMMHIYVNDGSYDSGGSILFPEYADDPYWGWYLDEDHLHIYYPLNMTSAGWATLYIGFPTQLPEGFSAYVVSSSDDVSHEATLKNIGRVVPATTPVIIKNSAGLASGVYPLMRWTGAVPDVPKYDNRFVGSYIGQEGKWGVKVNQETSITGSVLTLGRNSQGVVGFYKFNGEEIPPYRAYLTYNTVIDGANSYFTFVIDDTPDTPLSIFHDPFLLWQASEAQSIIYDITGRVLQGQPTRRGIYISNGKKIVK